MEKREQILFLRKIKSLYHQLGQVMSKRKLIKSLAAGALLMGLSLSSVNAQSYGDPQINPFGLDPQAEILLIPVEVDIDGDGDFDIMATGYNENEENVLFFIENTGSASSPAFAPRVENPFGFNSFEELTTPSFGDLDNDGDLDMMLGSYDSPTTGDVFYFENVGSDTDPDFSGAPVNNPFGLTFSSAITTPILVDLDNDGDLDILNSYEEDANDTFGFVYHENTGNASAPAFSAGQVDPFNLASGLSYQPIYDLADMDDDGDLDLIYGTGEYLYVGNYYQAFLNYIENTGTVSSPAFGTVEVNPFDLAFPDQSVFPFPAVVDLDDDGDLDILSFTYVYSEDGNDVNNVFLYFENGAPVNTAELQVAVDWNLFPTRTTDLVTMSVSEYSGERFVLEVFSTTGQRVLSQSITDGNQTISLDGHAPGMYFFRLATEDGLAIDTKKIIKQ